MTAPVQVHLSTVAAHTLRPSPLSVVILLPRVDNTPKTAGNKVTLDSAFFPALTFKEVHDADVHTDHRLGNVVTADDHNETGIGRAAYDYIEHYANVHFIVLPYEVSDGETGIAARHSAVQTALGAFDSSVRRANLPGGTCDIIIVPMEGAFGTDAGFLNKLETVCSSVGAVGIVDAGGIATFPAATNRVATNVPGITNIANWIGKTQHLHTYAISNRANISHYNNMWGSVIMAGHHSTTAALQGVGAHPYNLRHPVSGISGASPERVFDVTDGSSSAVNLDTQYYLSSIVDYKNAEFIWGGRSLFSYNGSTSGNG